MRLTDPTFAVQTPRRKRSKYQKHGVDRVYMEWAHPKHGNMMCCITGSAIYVRHHLRSDENGPLGTANHDDRRIIPIHPDFHDNGRGVHGPEGERAFLAGHGITDPVGLARALHAAFLRRDAREAKTAILNARLR